LRSRETTAAKDGGRVVTLKKKVTNRRVLITNLSPPDDNRTTAFPTNLTYFSRRHTLHLHNIFFIPSWVERLTDAETPWFSRWLLPGSADGYSLVQQMVSPWFSRWLLPGSAGGRPNILQTLLLLLLARSEPENGPHIGNAPKGSTGFAEGRLGGDSLLSTYKHVGTIDSIRIPSGLVYFREP
jgi:hypothetical protein